MHHVCVDVCLTPKGLFEIYEDRLFLHVSTRSGKIEKVKEKTEKKVYMQEYIHREKDFFGVLINFIVSNQT